MQNHRVREDVQDRSSRLRSACMSVSPLRTRVDTDSPALEGLAADVRDVEVRDTELLLSVEKLRRDALDSLAVLVLLLRLVHATHVELHIDEQGVCI